MKKDNRSHILIRYGVIIVFILLLSARIVMKLCDTTVIDADKWNQRANELLSQTKIIIPGRGNILASDGSVLATNLNFYTARLDYRAEKFNEKLFRDTIDDLAACMAEQFPVRSPEEWKKHLLKPLEKVKEKRPRAYKLMSGLSHHDMETMRTFPFFSIKNRNRNGLTFEKYMRRFNPYGDMARRSIGGVGETTESKEIHGISGLEKALDSLLYGKIGYSKMINLTKKITDWTDVPAIPGCDIVTTIDINMQDIVESELNNVLDSCGADWGVAVLMDVRNGDIKAISNLERNPRGAGYIEARNRAVMGYEPGSVVKTLSMMIAVEDGLVPDLNEVLPTGNGWAYAGGRPITDSHYTGAIRVGEVLEQSSNIGMARIITRKYNDNPGAFYSRVKELGFLEPMNTGIAGEVPPRFDSIPNDRGGRIALSRMSYGYATEIPPLYTLAIYNAIANDGVFVRPRLVKEIKGTIDSILPVSYMGNGRACSQRTAGILRRMLTDVVWGEHGTGRFLRNNTVRIAGKTGTCYMIENGAYNQSKKRLAFCGFFPADNPKYSCVVLTCHPTRNFFGAATTSGQVLRNIALKLYSRGMLDNSSDYRGASPSTISPTFYASAYGRKAYDAVKTDFALPSHKAMQAPRKTAEGSVPDVKGYSLREAIVALETAGYNVDYSGAGYVRSMSPGAGSRPPRGSRIRLVLGD
ncbi:MAG: transpeptidase family protein [Duncaniella sp.]|nr:transpeptidase family protein [Bacteroides sp.]MDE5827836.1 transpeptidase family protein [Duncaniella sp.]MDE6061481.1 transpeptidase family protein [Duncaniella sp.]MDE6824231.1 transpeptidase family protein [Duncaniella sp.]